jgi:uncharacterized membrane protein
MNRHPLDTFSLISGLLFATLGAVFMLDQSDHIKLDARWIPAIVVFVLGFAGIIANGRKALRQSRRAAITNVASIPTTASDEAEASVST